MKTKFYVKSWLILIGLMMMGGVANAITITSNVANGNWDAPGTWSPAQVPTAADDVIILSGHTITINQNNQTAHDVTVDSGGTLRFSGSSTTNVFTVNGNFTISGTFNQNNNQGWPVEVYGNFTVNAGGKYITTNQNFAGSKLTMKGAGTTITMNGTVNKGSNENVFRSLVIDAPGVVTLAGTSNIAFTTGGSNPTLEVINGILNANGKTLEVDSRLDITVTAPAEIASPLTQPYGTYTEDDCPSILWTNGGSGSSITVNGILPINNFDNSGKNNINFPNNGSATIVVFGTFTKTNNNTQGNFGQGTWLWGPDSEYIWTGQDQTHPGGDKPKINGVVNSSYSVPQIIQDALDGASGCAGFDAPVITTPIPSGDIEKNAITLNWSEVTGATSYKVYRSTTSTVDTGASATPVTTVSAPALTYKDGGLNVSTTYYYKVVATDGDCNGVSELASATTLPCETSLDTSSFELSSDAPSAGLCSGSTATVTLSGSETDVTYQLFDDSTPVGSPQSGTGGALTWPNMPAGNYSVEATGNSSFCDATAVLETTLNIAARPSGYNLVLDDIALKDAGTGDILYSAYSGTEVYIGVRVTNTGCNDFNSTGKYGIVFEGVNSPGSNNIFIWHDDTKGIDGPLLAGESLWLWTTGGNNSGALGNYNESTGIWTPTAGTYSIRARGDGGASNWLGDGTKFTGTVTVTDKPLTAPEPPTASVAQVSGDLKVTWNAVQGADYYTVYDCDGTLIADHIAGTSYTVSDVTVGEEYCFQVSATNAVDEGEKSNEASITVEDLTRINEDAEALQNCNEKPDEAPFQYWTIQTYDGNYIIDDGTDYSSVSGIATNGFLSSAGTDTSEEARWKLTTTQGVTVLQNVKTGRYLMGEVMNSGQIECGCYIGNNGINEKGNSNFREQNVLGLYDGDATSAGAAVSFEISEPDSQGWSTIRTTQWGYHYWSTTYLTDAMQGPDPNKVCPAGLVGGDNTVYSIGWGTSGVGVPPGATNYLFKVTEYNTGGTYPNLNVSVVAIDNDGVYNLGDPVTGSINICNSGVGEIPAGTPVKINYAFNGQYFYDYYYDGLTASTGMKPCAEIPFSFTPAEVTSGEEQLTVTVNSDRTITEAIPPSGSACDDNFDEGDVTVNEPCPTLASFIVKWSNANINDVTREITVNIDATDPEYNGMKWVETYAITSDDQIAMVTVTVNGTELELIGTVPPYRLLNGIDYSDGLTGIPVIVSLQDGSCPTPYTLNLINSLSTGTGNVDDDEGKELKDCFNVLGVQIPCDEDYARGTVLIKRFTDGSARKVLK